MISFGSLEDVVFMLHVKRKDRGLISPLSLTTFLLSIRKEMISLVVANKLAQNINSLSVRVYLNCIVSTYPNPMGLCTNCGTGLGC